MSKKMIGLIAAVIAALVSGALWLVGVPLAKAIGFTVLFETLAGLIGALLRWRYVATRATTVTVRVDDPHSPQRPRYVRPKRWWQRLNPHSKKLQEVIRPSGRYNKEVILLHPFHWMFYVLFYGVCVGTVLMLVVQFYGNWPVLGVSLLCFVVVVGFYRSGFRKTPVVNASVIKDRDDLTGVVALAGDTWSWPHYDYDSIDLRPRRTVYLFTVVLTGGLRLLIRLTTKWVPDMHVTTVEGENKFYEQGEEAIEDSVVEQSAELSDTLAPLDDLQFNTMRSAAQLLHTCIMGIERARLPHYNDAFLRTPHLIMPAGWVPGRPIPFEKRVQFYHDNRHLILRYIDPRSGVDDADEHGAAHTSSWFEQNHGIHVESAAFLADFDEGSQDMLSNRYIAQLVRELTGKHELSEDTALAIAQRSINIKSTGGGLVATFLDRGANVTTQTMKGHAA